MRVRIFYCDTLGNFAQNIEFPEFDFVSFPLFIAFSGLGDAIRDAEHPEQTGRACAVMENPGAVALRL